MHRVSVRGSQCAGGVPGELAPAVGRLSLMSIEIKANGIADELGQSEFRSVLSEDIDWKPFAAFPPSARLAVLVGDPSKPGPYLIRVKVPSGVKLMPHRHPEDRVYTVISGVFYIGLGDEFEAGLLRAYPPGAVIVLREIPPTFTGRNPANTSHR